jgi:DNA-binding NtrC family response regulator
VTALRVLFVEDSEDDAALESEELRRRGFAVFAQVVDTREGLARALAERWDAVLCDWNIPGFDALSALAMVEAADPDVPFLIVSGSVGEETAVGAMRAGAHDYLLKQNLARLGAAVERELREAKVRRERRVAVAALEQSSAAQSALIKDLQAALNARDEFLTAASHELKTPLTGLVLQIE